tara:strand:+ start:69 stop:725 length:657 start_codon:yes stop_codon:yes gene_type:complete
MKKAVKKPLEKQSKISRLFKHLKNNPNKLGYREMQEFVFYLDNPKSQQCSRGYWCTNFATLRHLGRIATDENKKYYLTKEGLLNINKPYTIKPKQTLESKYEQLQNDFEYMRERCNNLVKENCELWNENHKYKREEKVCAVDKYKNLSYVSFRITPIVAIEEANECREHLLESSYTINDIEFQCVQDSLKNRLNLPLSEWADIEEELEIINNYEGGKI